jgi:CRP-like cAMP-binding protein
MILSSINKRSFRRAPMTSAEQAGLRAETEKQPRRTSSFLAGRLRHELDETDLDRFEDLVGHERILADREILLRRGEQLSRATLLLEGFAFRTIAKADRRAIVGINVPGDFVDLHGYALQRLDHDVVAVGNVRVANVDHVDIDRVLAERPQLARVLWFASLLDASIHRRWIRMLGQHDAPRRIAHIFCELHTRLAFTGRASAHAVRTPFTQFDLADMCGISAVHANRAVSKLREMELAEIKRGTLYPRDWDALQRYAGFDAAYLFGDAAPA